MVVCWVAGTGPGGRPDRGAGRDRAARIVLPAMARSADVSIPAELVHVYHPAEIAALALAGLVIAVVGALLPASWAAATSTATALHAE